MFKSDKMFSTIAVDDIDKARQFYEETLGLKFIVDDRFALVFEANGVTIRVVNVSGIPEYKPFPFTILGWNVGEIVEEAKAL